MKRREFITAAAGVTAGAMVGGSASSAMAMKRTAEKRLQLYRCVKCGTIVEIVEPDRPMLAHCGKPMELIAEKVDDVGREKHVPIIEKVDGGYLVKVGSVPHPMTEEHWISWIELIADGNVHRQFLTPEDKPEATFCVEAEEVYARAYCNLHSLWKGV